ncbi:MAG: hypothetical protein AUJ52_09080 [Elusimicrobia bacterium CG1_02_63_36]|nr:MAG: hypothetical protein AUJ52_09080 [Elusimicrobia bacterium CG1_02_63_36]
MRYWISALVLIAAAGGDYLARIAPVGTGYTAKILCSGLFVAGRDLPSLKAGELTLPSGGILRMFSSRIDFDEKLVMSHFLGTNPAWAVWRPGLGCALTFSSADARRLAAERSAAATAASPLPRGPASSALAETLDRAFLGTHTRAVVVVHRGKIVAERYAPGFSAETPLLGWSMTKTATNALIGIRLKELGAGLDTGHLLPEWDAERAAVTVGQMLRMRSGLRFREVYAAGPSDVTRMLFNSRDASGFASKMPLEHAPGTYWSYSSGSSNILMRLLRSTFPSDAAYHDYPRRALFDKIGMRSAVFETDAFGTFVGSSFLYATARDWARFGLLYLNDGVCNGTRILPEGWVAKSVEPSGGGYGAHLWVDLPEEVGGPEDPAWADAFYFLGHEGQSVSVVPSRELVVVRLGLNRHAGWNQRLFLSDIIESLARNAP